MSIPEPDNQPARALQLALRVACAHMMGAATLAVLDPTDPALTRRIDRAAEHYRRVGAELAGREVQRWTITEAGRAYLAAFPEGPPEEQL